MNLVDIALCIDRITYKADHALLLLKDSSGEPYMQVNALVWDEAEGKRVVHRGRKWDLSYHMTESEVVLTALKAYLTFEEHEARETFKYQGVAIFGPHLDVRQLAVLIRSGKLRTEVRDG